MEMLCYLLIVAHKKNINMQKPPLKMGMIYLHICAITIPHLSKTWPL